MSLVVGNQVEINVDNGEITYYSGVNVIKKITPQTVNINTNNNNNISPLWYVNKANIATNLIKTNLANFDAKLTKLEWYKSDIRDTIDNYLNKNIASLNSQYEYINKNIDYLKSISKNGVTSGFEGTLAKAISDALPRLIEDYKSTISVYFSNLDLYDASVLSYKELAKTVGIDAENLDAELVKLKSDIEMYRSIYNYERTATVNIKEIPNPKDDSQWLAGGVLYNNKMAGGFIFNASEIPDIDGKIVSSETLSFASKAELPMLNEGYSEIQSVIKSFDMLDLLSDSRQVEVVRVGVTITKKDGSSTFKEMYIDTGSISSSDVDVNMSGSVDLSSYGMGQSGEASMSAIAGLFESSDNIMSSAFIGNAIMFTIENLSNGKIFNSPLTTIGNFLIGGSFSSIKSMISGKLSGVALKAIGIKDTGGLMSGLVSGGMSLLVSEVFEMLLGYDKSFGFGGEYSDKISNVTGKASFGESKGFMGSETLFNQAMYNVGLTDVSSTDYFDTNGNYLLTSTNFDNGNMLSSDNILSGDGILSASINDNGDNFGMIDDMVANFDGGGTLTSNFNADSLSLSFENIDYANINLDFMGDFGFDFSFNFNNDTFNVSEYTGTNFSDSFFSFDSTNFNTDFSFDSSSFSPSWNADFNADFGSGFDGNIDW